MRKSTISKSRLFLGITFLASILIISGSCTKTSNMYGTGGGGGSKGGPGINEVWIQGMAFTPATITVAAGTTITWTNQDAVSHTVTSNTNVFNSGSLGSSGIWSYTFNTSGNYPYYCAVHPSMKGTVVVN
jgi:plastocyanin